VIGVGKRPAESRDVFFYLKPVPAKRMASGFNVAGGCTRVDGAAATINVNGGSTLGIGEWSAGRTGWWAVEVAF